MSDAAKLTEILARHAAGDAESTKQLFSLVFDELHRIAAKYMRRERSDHTLQPTALVHEAYLKLADSEKFDWKDRTHFFATAAQVMRQLLVDHARGKRRLKRGGEQLRVTFNEGAHGESGKEIEILAINDALTKLAERNERQCRVVEMRYFAGMSIEEIAQALSSSHATVSRDWESAKAWLFRELKG